MAASPSNRNLYFAGTVSCLTAALFGYSVGFIGGEIVLPSFLSHFDLDRLPPAELASVRSIAVTSWIVGALLGVPLSMPVCSNLGRRLCLQFSALLYVLGALLQVFSDGRLAMFEVGRFINGLGVGAGTLVSPIFISEISPPSERGMLMSGYQVAVQTGALIGFWVAFVSEATLADSSSLQWQIPVSLQLIVGAILLAGTLLIPESPRFLAECGIGNGDNDNATYTAMVDSLSWIRRLPSGHPLLLSELADIQDAARLGQRLKQRSSFFAEVSAKKYVRRELHVGIGLMVAQNMVGLNALNYYAPVIFMSAGFTTVSSSLLLTGIFGVVKLVSSLAFMFSLVRVRGNLFWLKLGSAVCGIAMLVLAYEIRVLPPPSSVLVADAYGAFKTTTTPTTTTTAGLTASGIISVLAVYVFAFAFGVSLGPISWNVCSEIFPLHINTTCCAITTCTQWVFQIVISAATPPLLARLGWGTYLIYAGFCALSFIWVAIFVPETRGVSTGKPMAELFGAAAEQDDEVEEEEEALLEVSETTALLLAKDRRRRSSLAALS